MTFGIFNIVCSRDAGNVSMGVFSRISKKIPLYFFDGIFEKNQLIFNPPPSAFAYGRVIGNKVLMGMWLKT
jgi:hypothetical protein